MGLGKEVLSNVVRSGCAVSLSCCFYVILSFFGFSGFLESLLSYVVLLAFMLFYYFSKTTLMFVVFSWLMHSFLLLLVFCVLVRFLLSCFVHGPVAV